MSSIDAIARAVLYEGYLLWPYRRNTLKNQHRWTFGAVMPQDWHAAHPDDACSMRAECLTELLSTSSLPSTVTVTLRFLQIVTQGAVEHEVMLEPLPLDGTSEAEKEVRVASEAATDLHGTLSASVEVVTAQVRRLAVTLVNSTPWSGTDREAALRASFISTHFALRAESAAFVSQTDPPPELREAAKACSNHGCWPVLVGERGERSLVLAAPIILSDYPSIAPESPGDLFDGGEIDELLTLNILGLTEEEWQEMRTDPRTREILDRTLALTRDQMLKLHGTVRDYDR